MRKGARTILFCLIAAILVVGLFGCGPGPTEEATEAPEATTPPDEGEVEPTEPPEEEEEVVLRVGHMRAVDCWNPYSCTSVWFWGHLIIEGFADHGPASEGCPGVPRLAESWEVSDDGRTWTIKLHEGITFSDGTPCTAQTVVDFINWFRENMAEWYAEALLMEEIEVVDELTLRYTTSEPILNSPEYDWQWWYILNPEIWGELEGDEIYSYEPDPLIGTGPYEIAEHEPGNYLILDARDDYYMGEPPIDRVVIRQFSNADAIVSALRGGEIDLTSPWMPPETADALLSMENVTVEEKPPGRWYELVFNMAEGGIKHPAIEDAVVREAVDYAIDKEQIVEVALLGRGITCPTNWGCGPNYADEMNPDLTVTPYDPEYARELLDDAGYVDSDGDGIRETPDGEPLEFRLLIETNVGPAITMADQIEDWLGAVGIQVTTESQEWGTWVANVLDNRDFDIAIYADSHDIDAASMDFWFSCWSAESGSAAFNWPGYCNPEMDDLVYQYWNSSDPEGRWEPMFEAQRILNEDRPIINLAGVNSIQAYRSDRFEFPLDTCDVAFGMYDPQGLLNAEVK